MYHVYVHQSKTDNSKIGYKQRTHIAKALKSRSKAIQRALASYNQAAAEVDPPRPKLTWAQIVEYSTIAEFELLRTGAREDIRNLDWADARNRRATLCHLKLVRAHEEVTRLNVEIKRLATWIVDEDQHLLDTTTNCSNPLLASALRDFMDRRKRVNINLQITLEQVYSLDGYSGDTSVGERTAGGQRDGSPVHDVSSDEDDTGDIDNVFEGVSRLLIDE